MASDQDGARERFGLSNLRRSSSANRLRRVPSLVQPITYRYEIQSHTTRLQRLTKAFKVYRLVAATSVSILIGLVVGLVSRPYAKHWTERQFMYIELPGELYLRFLKLMIIPLLVSNVILSFGKVPARITSYLGKLAAVLYLSSNIIAILIAITVVFLIRPGYKQDLKSAHHIVINNVNNNQIQRNGRPIHLNQHDDSIDRNRDYHPFLYRQIVDDFEPELTYMPIVNRLQQDETTVVSDESIYMSSRDMSASIKVELSSKYLSAKREAIHSKPITTGSPGSSKRLSMSSELPIDVLLDVLRNLVPDSIIGATMQQTRTRLYPPHGMTLLENGSTNPPMSQWPMGHEMMNQSNIVGLLIISIITGIVLSNMKENGAPFLDLCECIAELSLRISMIAINLSPPCIMFLLIGQVARAKDLSSVAGELFLYCLTMLTGLVVHGLLVLPVLYYVITKKSSWHFFISMADALLASLATSSSSVSMALTLRSLSKLKLQPVIVRAFGPLGLVFNMNGTTIYQVIGTVFIAQISNINLSATSILLIVLTSIVASLSTSGIPSSGLMTMLIVLDTVKLPAVHLSLIYIVEFIIDRLRTVINVWTGALVCGIIDSFCRRSLFKRAAEKGSADQVYNYGDYLPGLVEQSAKGTCNHKLRDQPRVISITITPPQESSSM